MSRKKKNCVSMDLYCKFFLATFRQISPKNASTFESNFWKTKNWHLHCRLFAFFKTISVKVT